MFLRAADLIGKGVKMKVKDILSLAALISNDEELSGKIEQGSVDATDSEVKRYLSAYNLVVSELYEYGVKPMKKETLTSESGRYEFADFTVRPSVIKKALYRGYEVPFEVTDEYVGTNYDEVTFEYIYKPKMATLLTDDAEYADILSKRTLAYGVAAEKMLLCGLFGDAVVMRNRFEEGVSAYTTSKKYNKIKSRSFV